MPHPRLPSLDLAVHRRLGELPRWIEGVLPIANQRRTPFRVEAPDGPTDALSFQVFDDRRPVDGGIPPAASEAAPTGGRRGRRRRARGRRQGEPSEFRRDDGILRGGEPEILLPFRLPRLG